MDPLSAIGLVSSVVQIADASFKIMRLLDTMKDGGKDRRRLSDEITVLWMTLRNLETQFAPLSAEQNGAWMKPLDSLAEPGGVFEQLKTALDDVWDKLTTSDSKIGKAMQTLRWPLTQSYVDRTIAHIERLKSSVAMVEGQASIALAQEMRDDVANVKKTVDDGHFKEVIDWLSPLNFRQKQESITPAPGTGSWFFTSEEFQSWHTNHDRWLWCYGIPGAGKTFLASSTVSELRRLHQADGALVLIAFCSFDSADSQSVENLISSLLKQVVQSQRAISENVEKLFRTHFVSQTRPKLHELIALLAEAVSQTPKVFIVVDALDELAEESKRKTLLDTLLSIRSKPKIMVTSRKIESIANQFGYTMDGIYCDGCQKTHLETYHHCEDCVDFDHCDDCYKSGEAAGHVFVTRFSSVKMRIAAQPEDIENYINRRIEVEDDLRQMVERQPKLRTNILDTIVENAKDMFLLARFHMDALADCLTPSEVQHALSTLPTGIDDTYDNAMARIGKLSANRQRAVKKLLMWVSYAERPLSVKELEHATAVSRGVRELRPDAILSAKVLTSLSAGLVIIDENEHVRLTHKTAESYFTEKRATLFPQGEVELAECCLAYLQLQAFDDGPCPQIDESDAFDARLKVYPFLGYAALNWGNHARRCLSEIVTPQALMFLRNKPALAASVQSMWYSDQESYNSWDVPDGVDSLHLASYFGLSAIVKGLLSDAADPNVRDPLGTTALIYACSNGHSEIADILLDSGADPSIVDERGSTAMLRAVNMGHVDICRRLAKEKDIKINAFYTSFNYFTPLILAIWNETDDIAKIILSRSDVDVNLASPTARWTPLTLAAETDRGEILDALLQHPSIDKDHPDAVLYTAVHYAALGGNTVCLEILLKSGCNANAQDDQGGRPIQRAVDYNQFDSVKILLQHGVECDFVDMLGRNILHAAAVNNRSQIMRLLLENRIDVDVNAQGDNGETPLHDAVTRDFYDTANVLLEYGARTDIVNKAGRSPARVAVDKGFSRLVERLQEARAKERAIEEKGGAHLIRKADTFVTEAEKPFINVVQNGTLEDIRLRLARIDLDELNAPNPDTLRDTALHFACSYRGVEVANLLLEAGAFVDPVDAFGRTPLTVACQGGDADVVQCLVKHGADVNMRKFQNRPLWEIALKNGGSKAAVFLVAQPQTEIPSTSDQLGKVLGWAAALGDLEACRRLVDAGAPAHLKNSNGATPAQIAKGWDQEEAEKFLMEAAARQRAAATELRKIDTLKEEESKADQDETVMSPPRRSPTSKKEFIDLVSPVRRTSTLMNGSTVQVVQESKKTRQPSPTLLALATAFAAIILAMVSSYLRESL